MKTRKYLRNTLAKAHDLQSRYTAIGAPSTQTIRNPFPMWQLVQTVLNTLPAPEDKIQVEVKTKTTLFGKQFIRTRQELVPAGTVLNSEFWQTHGKTIHQICDSLRAAGYIVNEKTVSQTMSALGECFVSSVSSRRNPGKGRPASLFFVRK